ncbi:transposase [Anaerococcus nagyae]|uniref:Transposase n=1 Tax=Anaerococcus nagyae TaxID=1755241 RepID=A0A3E2TLH6_9FIRM|nr:transposase [Anaerococcus nagyae]
MNNNGRINLTKHYEENFKKQIVNIYSQGNHSLRDLSKEYGMSTLTINGWVNRYNNTKSFDIDDNRSEEEKELIKLRKEVKQLEIDNCDKI